MSLPPARTTIENRLLVGISIGLLVVVAAIGTLILSKGILTTFSQSTLLQQRGSFALRVIGVELRQAGSIELETPPGAMGVVFSSGFDGFNGGGRTVDGPSCLGGNAAIGASPLVENAADLQVWYRVETLATGASAVQRMTATQVQAASLWPNVTAVEICLDLRSEMPNFPASGSHIDCQGASTARNGCLHRVFSDIFDLRTQGSL